MQVDLQALATILINNKKKFVPVLTGNTDIESIKYVSVDKNEIVLSINAPFTDLNKWVLGGSIPYANIVHTGLTVNGKTDYAMWVNDRGAWGRPNKSQYWANRLCFYSCIDFAKTLGANVEIINLLKLYMGS